MTVTPGRLAVAGLIWLGLFSVVFSLGSALGLWSASFAGGFPGLDLPAGLALGAVLLLVFVLEPVRYNARPGGRG